MTLNQKRPFSFQKLIRGVFTRSNFFLVLGIAIVPVLIFTIQAWLGTNGTAFNWINLLGTVLYSFVFTASLFYGCSLIVDSFNILLPWKDQVGKRLFWEIIIILSYASIIQLIIIYGAAWLGVYYNESGWPTPLEAFEGVLFGNTITIIVISIFEGIYFFQNWRESLLASERLAKEHAQSQYANLKAQLDPHFMFNSLNVLSGLIRKDPNKAEHFIDDFARVYRYVLDVKNEMVVSLKDELQFVQHYLNLQQIRFNHSLQVDLQIDPQKLALFLPPLSLQEVVGNAIKHNSLSPDKPLQLKIVAKGNRVIVSNNMQARRDKAISTGVGLQNLKERYAILSKEQPHFFIKDQNYFAELPLILPES
jgi:hypothetical protein